MENNNRIDKAIVAVRELGLLSQVEKTHEAMMLCIEIRETLEHCATVISVYERITPALKQNKEDAVIKEASVPEIQWKESLERKRENDNE